VEYAAQSLPALIKQALESLLVSSRGHVVPAAVSSVLSDCIIRFDHTITADFTRMFPGGPAGLQSMSTSQIRYLFQDRTSAAQNLAAATRCLQGSTALLTLTDPSKQNLWIANLGDCQAGMSALPQVVSSLAQQSGVLISHHHRCPVLGSRTRAGDWAATFATTLHNGDNPSELLRIRNQHPGERECLVDNRIVGFLSPTRCERHLAVGEFEIL
jgi:pyruvate dehydrogenase phosphatase